MNILRWSVKALFVLALVGAVAGCGRTVDPHAAWRGVVTQVSTYPSLLEGRYDGQLAVSNLVVFGDHGLGTFDGLDGEMVVRDGVVYRITPDQVASVVSPDTTTPFAQVTWFTPDEVYNVMAMDQNQFLKTMNWKHPDDGRIRAIRITGHFKELHLRSVPRQSKPYLSLDKVVLEHEAQYTLTNVTGTLIGFYAPAAAGTILPRGFHLHFLSTDATTGGHVYDFTLSAARIELSTAPELRVLLPTLPTEE